MKSEKTKKTFTRRTFAAAAGALPALAFGKPVPLAIDHRLPGIWRVTLGKPEAFTPVEARHYSPAKTLSSLPIAADCPLALTAITGQSSKRGFLVSLPLAAGEMVYGFGLQLQSFLQRGLKKKLRVNADPAIDSGDSHAPVPFYVTTRGYGILIDTARYATFYCGNKKRKGSAPVSRSADGSATTATLPAAYSRFHTDEVSEVFVEIPEAEGIDVYIFAGPSMLQAVQRYNLFSGGGPIPPRWGLGFWYRCFGQFDSSEVLALAAELRDRRIPCDVLGLEPGWQSHSYSCSFVWSDKFPEPAKTMASLSSSGYHVNLWEHAFTHPSSPIHSALQTISGDYEVWDGLVPDFLDPKARQVFAGFHDREHVSIGVSGYKLDECDNSDFTRNWSFPEFSRYPSGVDGEQMHCFFGLRYQDAIQSIFDKRRLRTWGLVRSSHALATPYPYVLYSDLYNHTEFILGLVNSGFSGLLWCPEVRDAQNPEDLLRRLQTVIFSSTAMVNAWYIKNPPWKQIDREANNSGQFAADWQDLEASCRKWIELRMQFVPYLHSAFIEYQRSGVPPFRALVLDFPEDPETWTIDNQFLCGDALLIAPLVAGQHERQVYLPKGEWADFWTGEVLAGGRYVRRDVPIDSMLIFVKDGALLPLAKPTLNTADPDSMSLTVHVYGRGGRGGKLYEEHGTDDPAIAELTLTWDESRQSGRVLRTPSSSEPSYNFNTWKPVNYKEPEKGR